MAKLPRHDLEKINLKEFKQFKRSIIYLIQIIGAMRQKLRLEAIKYISDELKCVRCSYSNFNALQIDHINGGGRKETKKIENGYHVYQVKYWRYILALPQEEVRKRYQILCANCNILKLFEENEFIKR